MIFIADFFCFLLQRLNIYALAAKKHTDEKNKIKKEEEEKNPRKYLFLLRSILVVLLFIRLMFKNKSSELEKSCQLLPRGSTQLCKQVIDSHLNIYKSLLWAPGAGYL